MAKLSADKKSVTVEKGDTLSAIAKKYLGSASKYTQLASINDIPNANKIYIGQVIKLYSSAKSSTKKSNSNKPTINHFGKLADSDNELYATWTWSKSHTKSYKVVWTYYTKNKVWFNGTVEEISVDSAVPSLSRQSTYSIPDNALKVRFKVKPISTTYTKNKKETNYWKADWSTEKTWTKSEEKLELDKPSGAPTVTIEKYKLTAELQNINIDKAKGIQFQVVKNDSSKVYKSGKATIKSQSASVSFDVDAGAEYKVRCRAYVDSTYSEWTDYSSNVQTIPSTPAGFIKCKARSKTEVALDWESVKTATSYDIEYATKKTYFDKTDQTQTITGITGTARIVTGLESGYEYFFRLRAVNEAGKSGWSGIKSAVIGSKPAAPTTWSSSTTVTNKQPLNLYWVHNSVDGSSQEEAQLEIITNNKSIVITVPNDRSEEEKDKTSVYTVDTTAYTEGTLLEWRVRTRGIIDDWSPWSVQRTINIYAPPTLELHLYDIYNREIGSDDADTVDDATELTVFPLIVSATPGPDTQNPIGYHLSIKSRKTYTTVDRLGNEIRIKSNEEIFSKFYDVTDRNMEWSISASDLDLENNIPYKIDCTVSLDSGLTVTERVYFGVAWEEDEYSPNASITYDPETYTTIIEPRCVFEEHEFYEVVKINGIYDKTSETLDSVYQTKSTNYRTTTGETVRYGNATRRYEVSKSGTVYKKTSTRATDIVSITIPDETMETSTGEHVLYGTLEDGTTIMFCEASDNMYYCEVSANTIVQDVLLSVYRREYDGRFVEIATELDNVKGTSVVDPHPSLDLARYRIVAMSKTTGAISYYDLPGEPIDCSSIIIQWDEDWSSFDVSEDDEMEEPPWRGSLLELPYNIDVSESNDSDVEFVEFVGRSHPVSYYGTHLGETSTWNTVIPSSDKETIYGLRRLQKYLGDVYVREPNGLGYWANISVSFSQKHTELTIPVTISITRVEGGK